MSENVQRLQSADEEIRLERDRLNRRAQSCPNPIWCVDNDNQSMLMNQRGAAAAPAVGRSDTPTIAAGRKDQIASSNEAKFTSFLASCGSTRPRSRAASSC